MSQPKNSSTSTITPTSTHNAAFAAPAVRTAAANTSTTPAEATAILIPIPKPSSHQTAALTRRGAASSSQSSSSLVFDSSCEWEEPHPGQRLVLDPLGIGSCSCSSESHGSSAEVAIGSGSDSGCSRTSLGRRDSARGPFATKEVSRNDMAAKSYNHSLTSSSSLSSTTYRHRHLPLAPLWFARGHSRTSDQDVSQATAIEPAALIAPLSILTSTNNQPSTRREPELSRSAPPSSYATFSGDALPSSPLSPSSPQTPTKGGGVMPILQTTTATSWLSLGAGGDSDNDDDDDLPLGFRIDCDSVCESSTSTALETATIAATTLCGDERTITSSDGDASTARGVVIPAHPLTDFSNFLGLQSPVPPRSIATQDSNSTIRQTIGSRCSSSTEDAISGPFVLDPSRLSHTTTVNQGYDDDDMYGWEAELEHRKSNSCSATARPSIVEDLRRSVNKKKHSSISSSSSSSNSVISSSSERGEPFGRRRGEAQTRRRSFFQRVFSGKGPGHPCGKDAHCQDMPESSSTTAVPTIGEPSTVPRAAPQASLPTGPIPSVPQLTALLSNYTTMRESNRL